MSKGYQAARNQRVWECEVSQSNAGRVLPFLASLVGLSDEDSGGERDASDFQTSTADPWVWPLPHSTGLQPLTLQRSGSCYSGPE